jgi:hypothetical protein
VCLFHREFEVTSDYVSISLIFVIGMQCVYRETGNEYSSRLLTVWMNFRLQRNVTPSLQTSCVFCRQCFAWCYTHRPVCCAWQAHFSESCIRARYPATLGIAFVAPQCRPVSATDTNHCVTTNAGKAPRLHRNAQMRCC